MSIFYWAIPTRYDTVIIGGSFSNPKIIINWYGITGTCTVPVHVHAPVQWLNNIAVKNINIFEMINDIAFNIFALNSINR